MSQALLALYALALFAGGQPLCQLVCLGHADMAGRAAEASHDSAHGGCGEPDAQDEPARRQQAHDCPGCDEGAITATQPLQGQGSEGSWLAARPDRGTLAARPPARWLPLPPPEPHRAGRTLLLGKSSLLL